jgi:membrane-associated phospholipid phosphatase
MMTLRSTVKTMMSIILMWTSGMVWAQPTNIDYTITRSINHINSSFVTSTSKIASDALLPLVGGIPLAMIIAGNVGVTKDNFDAKRDMAETALLIGASEVMAYGVISGVKALVRRERPYKAYPNDIIGRAEESSFSFPSGHAAGSSALATTLILQYPQWYVVVPASLYALTTSFARMHLGVHYLTDIAVGMGVGIGVAVLTHSLRNSIFQVGEFALPGIPPGYTGPRRITSVQPPTNAVGVILTPQSIGVVVRL